MKRTLTTALIYVLANGVGLLVAALIVEGFTIDVFGFLIAAVLLSAVEALAGPLITKLSTKNIPHLQGGVALITTFVGLGVTNLIMPAMSISGITAWLAATLLVWLGALIASIVLPLVVFKETLKSTAPKAKS